MKKNIFSLIALMAMLIAFIVPKTYAAEPTENNWYWLMSDDNYSKYIDPESVVITKAVTTSHGKVPTDIEVWTKTGYSYAGAAETIDSYELTAKLPDPAKLSYSTARLLIKPQNRTVQYLEEHFFDANGAPIWSKATAGKVHEVNSQQFDEAFYTAAIDQAAGTNDETNRAKASDRWLTIYDVTTPNGVRTHTTADTSTMRMKDNNLVFWEWEETKDNNGQVTEIKFMKVAANLPEGTERVVRGQYWSASTGWQSMDADLDGTYRMISPESSEYQSIVALRQCAEKHSRWINRYSLDN